MKRTVLILFVIIGLSLSANAQDDNHSQDALNAQENSPELTIGVQPNPASDFLTIETSSDEKAVVQIIDVLGNTIWNATFYKTEMINITEYRNGIYFVTVSSKGKRVSRKVIVRH
jgi:hypothetical protein